MGTIPMDPATLSQYLQYPIQAPPPGVTPNFVNPDSTSYQVYAIAGVCTPLMLFFASLRWGCKIFLKQKVILVDETNPDIIVLQLFSSLDGFVIFTDPPQKPGVSGGAFGRHAWNILLGAFTKTQLVLALLVEIFLPVAICLVKVSVLILYLRVFRVLNWMRIVSIVSMALIVMWHLALSIAFAASCAPSTGDTQLDFLAAFISQKCSDTRILVVLQGVGNVATDVWLILLPLPAVWALQMPLRQKIAVSSMFMVGVIACVASMVGLVYRAQYYTAGEDNIRLVVPVWVTCMVEETAGVIICCSPATTMVFKNAKQPVFSWLSSVSQRVLRKSSNSSTKNSGDHSYRLERIGSSGSQGSQGPIYHQRHQQGQNGANSQQMATNAVYDPVNPQDGHAAWAKANAKGGDLKHLHPGEYGIERKTEYQVSRDGLGH
ncbi:hypothetical protein PG994_004040 [Apiospora phragmitis]|uniref:Rhodopsin domain-containing protein n=1 Tax=Apiospora phragmitis TaxID=2905665 RepID=A0ABR1VZY5_9PEZI